MPDEMTCWLAMMNAGIGGGTLRPLLDRYGSVTGVLAAALQPGADSRPSPALVRLRGVSLDEMGRLAADPMWRTRRLIPLPDPGYPTVLHEISSPPSALIVEGNPIALRRLGVAIVGTRQPPAWAESLAFTVGRELASRGLAVVSGLAMGIDAAAHRGALAAAGGVTVAVLGCGHDKRYPMAHASLAAAVAGAGAVISEFLPDAEAEPHRLAARNRLISGLSRALIVVAARPDSGSRHAVSFAHQQGRLVLAVPGTPGCDELLGAGRADPLEPPVDWGRLAATIARQ